MDCFLIKIPDMDIKIVVKADSEAGAIKTFRRLANTIIEGITAVKVEVKNKPEKNENIEIK